MRLARYVLLSFVVLALGGRVGADDEKADPVAKALAELLRPREVAGDLPERTAPVPSRTQQALEQPGPVLLPDAGRLPRVLLPLPSGKTQPRPPRPQMPLAYERTNQHLPQALELPAGPLLGLPGPDLSQPLAVIVLSPPLPDRVPLTDPTRDASLAAALAAAIASRSAPAPFEKLSLPDPFEHQATARLQTASPEAVELPSGAPRTPPKTLQEKSAR